MAAAAQPVPTADTAQPLQPEAEQHRFHEHRSQMIQPTDAPPTEGVPFVVEMEEDPQNVEELCTIPITEERNPEPITLPSDLIEGICHAFDSEYLKLKLTEAVGIQIKVDLSLRFLLNQWQIVERYNTVDDLLRFIRRIHQQREQEQLGRLIDFIVKWKRDNQQ